jgi:hypothetical protein
MGCAGACAFLETCAFLEIYSRQHVCEMATDKPSCLIIPGDVDIKSSPVDYKL